MNWELTILGANSAVPTLHRFPSGQILRTASRHILLDCGEGSQMRMMQYNEKPSKISLILISHLHGDHIFGLPGLLTSFQLYRRQQPLVLVGPRGIREFVENVIGVTESDVAFPLEIRELVEEKEQRIWTSPDMDVIAFPVRHRIPTFGYRIDENINRKYLDKEKIRELGLTHFQIRDMMKGESILIDGSRWTIEDLERIRQPRSYVYMTDTLYLPENAKYASGATLLYHESTFLESDKELAAERYHSTARQAGMIARDAQVNHLLLGHYSSRYPELGKFKEEARHVFPSVFLASSGKRFKIKTNGEVVENQDLLSS